MQIKNTYSRYGLVSIILHWTIAFLLMALIIVGLQMVNMPLSRQKVWLFGIHKEYGILALLLAALRIIWRWSNVVPRLDLIWIETIAARLVHWMFYCFMFALPLTGWLMSSALGFPVAFFGYVLPDLVAVDHEKYLLFTALHKWLAYALIIIIFLHALAALKHHFFNKDNVLRRIFYV